MLPSRGWTRPARTRSRRDRRCGNGVEAIDTVFMLAERKYSGVSPVYHRKRQRSTIEGVMRGYRGAIMGCDILPPMRRPFDNEQIKTLFCRSRRQLRLAGPARRRSSSTRRSSITGSISGISRKSSFATRA